MLPSGITPRTPPPKPRPPDFGVEVRHSRELVRRLSKRHGVAVPRVYEHLCTSKVGRCTLFEF